MIQMYTRLTWEEHHQHNLFAQFAQDDAEKHVDEYMHTMGSDEQCDAIDSYLVPVFKFIIIQYSIKAGLEKVKARRDF
jgi:hypothetical protein